VGWHLESTVRVSLNEFSEDIDVIFVFTVFDLGVVVKALLFILVLSCVVLLHGDLEVITE